MKRTISISHFADFPSNEVVISTHEVDTETDEKGITYLVADGQRFALVYNCKGNRLFPAHPEAVCTINLPGYFSGLARTIAHKLHRCCVPKWNAKQPIGACLLPL